MNPFSEQCCALLKKIRELKKVKAQDSDLFVNCVRNSIKNITSWNTESEYQLNKIKLLLKDVRKFLNYLEKQFDFQKEGLNDKSRKALNTTPVKQKTSKLQASSNKKTIRKVDVSKTKGKGKALF